jgi:hypothetical protein
MATISRKVYLSITWPKPATIELAVFPSDSIERILEKFQIKVGRSSTTTGVTGQNPFALIDMRKSFTLWCFIDKYGFIEMDMLKTIATYKPSLLRSLSRGDSDDVVLYLIRRSLDEMFNDSPAKRPAETTSSSSSASSAVSSSATFTAKPNLRSNTTATSTKRPRSAKSREEEERGDYGDDEFGELIEDDDDDLIYEDTDRDLSRADATCPYSRTYFTNAMRCRCSHHLDAASLEKLLCVAEIQKAANEKEKGRGKSKKEAAAAAVSCPCPVYGCDEVWTRADAQPDREFQLTVDASLQRFRSEDDTHTATSKKMRVIDLVDEDD